MNLLKTLPTLAAALLTASVFSLVPSRAAHAQPTVTLGTEHVDLTFNYSGGWSLGVEDKDNGTDYLPGQALLQINPEAQVTRPAGAEWDFLGLAAGETLSVLPTFRENANLLYLGTNVEGTPSGTFGSYDATAESGGRVGALPWVKVQLVSISGPAGSNFSLWGSDTSGSPVVWMTTSDGISDGTAPGSDPAKTDAIWINEGSHIHFNWGFSKPGTYEVTLKASGFVGGALTTSDPVTYNFTVLP
ncbi:MAG: TIGR03769 domain-containing protein [Cytophagales bacterium]|nr:TIGR03769 domain-containing protein [Armatimonadota bacterium]